MDEDHITSACGYEEGETEMAVVEENEFQLWVRRKLRDLHDKIKLYCYR